MSMIPPLHRNSSVLGVITHYRCEPWLAQAIESLVNQTRPLEGIVVLDDASPEPPVEIVRRFPRVTLMTTQENVGTYRLTQAIVECTRYDAYLNQDADDWSTPERLALSLAGAEHTGAEMLGTQSLNVAEGLEELRSHPLDVNAAYLDWPEGWFMSWGTSIFSRGLVLRLGGLATGMRFSGDLEFMSRAHHAAKMVNVPHCCYYRRRRPGAMTSAPETGKGSPARVRVESLVKARAVENAVAVAAGRAPNLAPLAVAEPIAFRHLLGPALREVARERV